MIITCRRCSTKFRLDDALVSPLAKAKCTFCGNIFIMADGMENEDFQTALDVKEQASPETVMAEAESSKKNVEAILKGGDLYNVDGKDKKRKKSHDLWPAVLMVFLLLVAGGALYALDPLGWRSEQPVAATPPAAENDTAQQPPAPADDTAQQSPASENDTARQPPATENDTAQQPPAPASENLITDPEALTNITLLDVKQYYVNNDKLGGQLFIIEGKVVNNFPTPLSLIRVEATLLDEDKNIIVSNQQFCGISVSYFQLQVLTEKELTGALSNKLEVLAKNTNVQPGAKVPFIFVFRSVPPTVRAFGVKVIEAQKLD